MTYSTTPAARRAGVTVRTIKRWRAQGMPTTRNRHGWHLVTEHDLLARARRLFDDLARQEYNARKALVEDTPRILADALSRALAILRSARLIAPGELLDLLSPIRLAASMGFLDGITRAETLKLMREQIDTPELPPPRSAEDDRVRDARDARLADRINARFATVHFNSLAEKWLN